MAGPHEVLGMARHLGIGTTEFLALYSDHGGTTLRFGADGKCVFLTVDGCKVHPRRPLVCRLYPLGRSVDKDGVEKFARFAKEEGCKGEFGADGTIETFLELQGVAPYIEWSRRYGELYGRMLGLLDRLDIHSKIEVSEAGKPGEGSKGETTTEGGEVAAGAAEEADRSPLSSWQDIDASLADFCAAKGIAVPAGIEEAIDLHLQAIREWLDGLEVRVDTDRGGTEGVTS